VPQTITLVVDGREVEVDDDGSSLLEVLRERLGNHSPKDGCSPQGQCGCCTVLVDGAARVACVTPARRVAGRAITTAAGLAEEERAAWASAFVAGGRVTVRLLHARHRLPAVIVAGVEAGRRRRRGRPGPGRPPVPLHRLAHDP